MRVCFMGLPPKYFYRFYIPPLSHIIYRLSASYTHTLTYIHTQHTLFYLYSPLLSGSFAAGVLVAGSCGTDSPPPPAFSASAASARYRSRPSNPPTRARGQ